MSNGQRKEPKDKRSPQPLRWVGEKFNQIRRAVGI